MPHLKKSLFHLSLVLCRSLGGTLSLSQSVVAQTVTTEQLIDLIRQCEVKQAQNAFRAALTLCLNAVDTAEKFANPGYLSVVYADLGLAYDSLSNYKKAIEFHTKALQIDIQIKNRQGEGADYGNLGLAYNALSNYPKAIEYYNKQLSARMVVLSACQSAQGQVTGDGVLGLSRAFISAGVPTILVTQWSVNDASTAYLMEEFYKLVGKGEDRAWALRQAMLLTKKKYPDPRVWAAFVLIGEG